MVSAPQAETSESVQGDRRLKVLISACECCPHEGSEQGIGWNTAEQASRRHEVWVLLHTWSRQQVEAELRERPNPHLHFIYLTLPGWLEKLRGRYATHVYYYLFQMKVYAAARSAHAEVNFDIAHHVTWTRYCVPSLLCLLGVPFVWGPLGGAECPPRSFWRDFKPRDKIYELLRFVSLRLGELDPFVRLTARRAKAAVAITAETAARLRSLGCRFIETSSGSQGMTKQEVAELAALPEAPEGLRFISIGRLIHWKGFHLGLKAFARAEVPGAEYWIVGDGHAKPDLVKLATDLGIAAKVRFWGSLPRDQTLDRLAKSHVLVHPSLHDSSPLVCIEAMAAGRPVLCLDLAGCGTIVTKGTGIKVPASTPEKAVEDLARGMRELAGAADLRKKLGEEGRRRVQEVYSWNKKGDSLAALYEEVLRR